jgi:hypothetical protein
MSVRERVGLLTLFTRWNIKVTVYGGKGGVAKNSSLYREDVSNHTPTYTQYHHPPYKEKVLATTPPHTLNIIFHLIKRRCSQPHPHIHSISSSSGRYT